jgi:hypothetical protein
MVCLALEKCWRAWRIHTRALLSRNELCQQHGNGQLVQHLPNWASCGKGQRGVVSVLDNFGALQIGNELGVRR